VLARVGPFAALVDEPFDEDASFAALRRAIMVGHSVLARRAGFSIAQLR
jgi:hypothetical protein